MTSTEKIQDLLDSMWKDYTSMNPEAQKIHDLFIERGDKVENDHIALRTFAHPKTSIEVLAAPFIQCGYKKCGEYLTLEEYIFCIFPA